MELIRKFKALGIIFTMFNSIWAPSLVSVLLWIGGMNVDIVIVVGLVLYVIAITINLYSIKSYFDILGESTQL